MANIKFDAPDYLQLRKGGSYWRMSVLKGTVSEKGSRKPALPPSMVPSDWRKARAYGFHNWAESHGALLSGGSGQWYTHCGEYFRDERDAQDVARLDHSGWYTDVDQCDLAIGIVARLPHGRFIAGYRWTSNDERVYFDKVHDDETQAARAADGHAESFAEMAREDSEKWEEARTLEIDIEDATARLRECIALRHRECMRYVRNEARTLIETIRDGRARLAGEFANYC